MSKRTPTSDYAPEITAQLTAFWSGVTRLEHKYQAHFAETPSRRRGLDERVPSTLAENLVLQCRVPPVRLSLHPQLPDEIVHDTRALFQQTFGELAR
jgi:hypothetical protein